MPVDIFVRWTTFRLDNIEFIRRSFRLNSLESYTSRCETVTSHWLGSVFCIVRLVNVFVDSAC